MDSAPPFEDGNTNTGGANGLRHAVPSALLVEGAQNVRLRDVQVVWGEADQGEFGSGLDVRNSSQIRWDQLDVSAFDADFPAIVVNRSTYEGGSARSGFIV